MYSRILVLALVLGVSSAFAGQKNSVRLTIGVETCEAYPEDCVRTEDQEDFYHLTGTVKGYRLTVKSYRVVEGKKVRWTRRTQIESSDAEAIALLAKQLEDTYVVRRQNAPVCEVVVRAAQFVNLLSVRNHGKLRPLYGPDGCWVTEYIFPLKNVEAAQELKKILRPLIVKTAFTPQN